MAARRRDAKKETFWRRKVRGQAGSGVSVRVWCRSQRLNEATFHWWRRELARRDAEEQALSFVPVHVTDDRLRDGDPQIEIVLSDGRCVRLIGSVNRQMLADVLGVLERRAC